LNFKTFYAISRDGLFFDHLPDSVEEAAPKAKNVSLILDEIVENFPAPSGDINDPFQMRITNLENDPYYGLMLVGKIARGVLNESDILAVVENDSKGAITKSKVKKIFMKKGIKYENIHSASVGEIVAIAGIDTDKIGATLCSTSKLEPLPKIEISPPSVVVKFEANTSPLVGEEGKFVTIKQLAERLKKESAQNISLDISEADSLGYYVKGRGELQLSILMETLRREGYEFQVKKPEVVYKEIDGKMYEPLEDLSLETPEEYIGAITTIMTERSAVLIDMQTIEGITRYEYKILTRNILGLRSSLINATKGNLVMSSFISDYVEVQTQRDLYRNGVLIASESGVASGYALNTIQERGELFVVPGAKIYEGMIVGINKYPEDMDVNAAKERHKSAVRMSRAEITLTRLKAPIDLTLDFALGFLAKDEMLEITPKSLRLRKIYLDKNARIKAKKHTNA
ncbi:translational GTPase TypA, partial [Candidatus Dojkabacteria bacterium]|nr:translational GTPase TypA [Candidatus Dojkabacteria bacterium]